MRKFIVLTLPTKSNGYFNVQHEDMMKPAQLWIPPTGDYEIFDASGVKASTYQVMKVNCAYRALMKPNGESVINLQELSPSCDYAPTPPAVAPVVPVQLLVHVGAELSHNGKDVIVTAVGQGKACIQFCDTKAIVIVEANGDAFTPRKTAADVEIERLVTEAVLLIDDDNMVTEDDYSISTQIEGAVKNLIDNGYRKLPEAGCSNGT